MLTAKLLIPAVAALGLFAFAGSPKSASAKSAGAAPPKPGAGAGAGAVPPPSVMEKINAAFLGADPGMIRQTADELEAAGFKAQADDLRAYAARIEQAIKQTPIATRMPGSATPPTASPGVPAPPPGPLPPTTPAEGAIVRAEPGVVTTLPEMVITPDAPRAIDNAEARMLAGRTALHLRTARKGQEDQALIARFQGQESALGHAPGGSFGSVPGLVDGIYGPKSALVLARYYAIVPAKPLYWAKGTWLQDKKSYRSEMQAYAQRDPQRADEWLAAGKVL